MDMNFKLTLPVALALCLLLTGCFTENYEKSDGTIVNVHSGKPAVSIQMLANGDGHLKSGSAFKLFSFYYECSTNLNPKGWGDDDAYLLAIFYPTNAPYHTLKTKAGSHQVYAYFVPNYLPDRDQLFTYLNLPNDANLTPEPVNEFFKFLNLPPNMVDVGGDWWYRWAQVNADLTNEISATESPANLSIPGSIPLHGTIKVKPDSWRHRNFFHTDIDLASDDGLNLKGKYMTYDYTRFEPWTFVVCAFWNGT